MVLASVLVFTPAAGGGGGGGGGHVTAVVTDADLLHATGEVAAGRGGGVVGCVCLWWLCWGGLRCRLAALFAIVSLQCMLPSMARWVMLSMGMMDDGWA